MPQTPRVVLAHAADEPAVLLIGAPLLLIAIFLFLEWRARRRERDSDGTGDH